MPLGDIEVLEQREVEVPLSGRLQDVHAGTAEMAEIQAAGNVAGDPPEGQRIEPLVPGRVFELAVGYAVGPGAAAVSGRYSEAMVSNTGFTVWTKTGGAFTKEGYGCEPGRGVRPSASRVRLTGKGAEYGLGEGVAGKSRAVSYSCNGGLCYDESL